MNIIAAVKRAAHVPRRFFSFPPFPVFGKADFYIESFSKHVRRFWENTKRPKFRERNICSERHYRLVISRQWYQNRYCRPERKQLVTLTLSGYAGRYLSTKSSGNIPSALVGARGRGKD
ncbi:MAG: hypothetical protein LBB48_08610 [Treponema sp.]|nr:hypothetical protein [Treponema sp.]